VILSCRDGQNITNEKFWEELIVCFLLGITVSVLSSPFQDILGRCSKQTTCIFSLLLRGVRRATPPLRQSACTEGLNPPLVEEKSLLLSSDGGPQTDRQTGRGSHKPYLGDCAKNKPWKLIRRCETGVGAGDGGYR
jgi:hypothetical protein